MAQIPGTLEMESQNCPDGTPGTLFVCFFFFLSGLHVSIFLGGRPIKIANCNQKKVEHGRHRIQLVQR
jgi:hypothetical protein